MIRGENSDSIPIDLVMEILSRLPAKSTARFRCVSKVWNDSVLSRPYFTELFLTRSSARPPRLLFAVERFDDWCFMTSPQPQNLYDNSSSLVVSADFHMKFPGDDMLECCGHASGFIYLRQTGEDGGKVYAICNPSTGQYARLPFPKWRRKSTDWRSFLGFDPVDKQYKVLSISIPRFEDSNKKEEPDQILTLGTGNDSWRTIRCPLKHFPRDEGICINGVLYYLTKRIDGLRSLIVCFDVRSEKFKFIVRDFSICLYDTKLINYKGKLGLITLHYDVSRYRGGGRCLKLCMWVIKDAQKPEFEWSKYFYFCWDNEFIDNCYPSIVGVTATGDIVLSRLYLDESNPFYVLYLSPERNTLQSVGVKGFGANLFEKRRGCYYPGVKVFADHVEDLRFIMMKSTDAISPPEEKRNPTSTSTISSKAHLQQDCPSINKFDSLRLLDHEECS